jgi:hypothetical protein
MKVFIFKLLVFLLCFFCLDQLFGLAFKKLFNQVKSGTIFQTNYALRECNEDLLIFGGSEVVNGLISNQIVGSLGMTCYNLGRYRQNIYYQYAILNELLKQYHPKIILISTFVLTEEEKPEIGALYPYYYDYQSIRDIIKLIEPDAKYKLWIRSYAYNSLLINVLQGNIREDPKTNGYWPLFEVAKDMQLILTPFKINYSDRTLIYFEKFINACIKTNSTVYVIDTPRYFVNNDIGEKRKIRDLLKEYSVDYFDFSTDTTFINHPELFRDNYHLNNQGALIFTKFIIDKITQKVE